MQSEGTCPGWLSQAAPKRCFCFTPTRVQYSKQLNSGAKCIYPGPAMQSYDSQLNYMISATESTTTNTKNTGAAAISLVTPATLQPATSIAECQRPRSS